MGGSGIPGGMGGGFERGPFAGASPFRTGANPRHQSVNAEDVFRQTFGHSDIRRAMAEMESMMKQHREAHRSQQAQQESPWGSGGFSRNQTFTTHGPGGTTRTTRIVFTSDPFAGGTPRGGEYDGATSSSRPGFEQPPPRYPYVPSLEALRRNQDGQRMPPLMLLRRALALTLLVMVGVWIAPTLAKFFVFCFVAWLIVALW